MPVLDFKSNDVPGVKDTKLTLLPSSCATCRAIMVMRELNEKPWSGKTLSRRMFCWAMLPLEQM